MVCHDCEDDNCEKCYFAATEVNSGVVPGCVVEPAIKQGLKRRMKMAEEEWKCPECGQTGSYYEIRTPLDSGVDKCPNCHIEVENIEE